MDAFVLETENTTTTEKENNTMSIEQAKESIINQMVKLFQEYGHYATYYGCKTIVDEWFGNKKPLIDRFSTLPNWNAEKFYVVFDADYKRGFDSNAIQKFENFIMDLYEREIFFASECKVFGKTARERQEQYNNMYEKSRQIINLYQDWAISRTDVIAGKDYFGWKLAKLENNNDYDAARRLSYDNWGSNGIATYDKAQYIVKNGAYFPIEVDKTKRKLLSLFNDILLSSEVTTSTLTDEIAEKIKELFPIRIGGGSTVMKALRRIFDLPEFKALRDWKTTELVEWTDPVTGEWRTREKNVSLETKISELGDAISPMTIKRHTIISLNPIDYLLMSNGHKWRSCHNIEDGEWRTGTLSYMLDKTSVIFYTVDKDYDGTEFEYQTKMQRNVFCISADGNTMIQNRQYPDGRDGGDMSLASQFRAVMQKVVSDAFDLPNYWTIKKGKANCREWTLTYGTHYEDYIQYNDGSVSFRNGYTPSIVSIGHDPIDPDNGEEHSETDDFNGSSGSGDATCAYCDGRYDSYYEDIYCEDNGNHYCCESCANNDGVYLCDDGYWHDSDNCYRDNYDDRYYAGEPCVETEDGNCYSSYDHAYDDGYRETADGYWYSECYMFQDSYTDEWYHENDMEVDIDCDHRYVSEENATDDGCVCVDGTWYADEDDALADGCVYVEDNDTWYSSDEDAEADGYHYIEEENEWVTEDEYVEYAERQRAEELANEDEESGVA